jgi:hypothetical protein
MKPYLLALVAAVALPACGKTITTRGTTGMSSTCKLPQLQPAEAPAEPGDADTVFIYNSTFEGVPSRIYYVSSQTRCVTQILEVPPASIPSWQIKMGDRVTSVFNGPRPPPPPPIGEPKKFILDLMVQVAVELDQLREVPREAVKIQDIPNQP